MTNGSDTEFTMIPARTKVIIVLFSMALSGCITEQEETTLYDPDSSACPVEYIEDLENTYSLVAEWKFIGFPGTTSTQITSPPCIPYSTDLRLTLEFSSDSNFAGGKAVINSYSGKYHLGESNSLKLDSIVTTYIGGHKELVDFETRFLTALEATERYQIEHNILTLSYGLSQDKMLFAAIPEN